MASSAPSEARELELVGKVEMRIALAKDEKLESVLKVYLPPVLLKLGSEHQAVRNKVIATCQHIKIRLSGDQNVVLPVAALLQQYKDNPESSMIRHFDLLFIQQSIGKLSPTEQIDLLPILLHGIAKDAGKPTCTTVFNLFLRLLPQMMLPVRGSKEDDELRTKLGLDEHPEDAEFVASWFGKLVLFNPAKSLAGSGGGSIASTGLSADDYAFLTQNGKEDTWNPKAQEGLNVTETKITALKFLTSGAFKDPERFIPAVFAAADTNSRISSFGEDLLKRSTVSLEDKSVISKLFDIYMSSKPALQTRILALMAKSSASTTYPDKIVRIVQGSIQPAMPDAPPVQGLEALKLRNAMFNFMNWVSRMGSPDDLKRAAPSIITFLRSFIEEQGWPVPNSRSSDEVALRALAYETLGSMAKTVPSTVLEPGLDLIRWLFRSLTEEKSSESIFISIEGALASLLNAFSGPLDPSLRDELRLLLLSYMLQEKDDTIVRSAKFVTVRWANRCLEYSDVVGRWVDILALGSSAEERSDVLEEGNKGLDPYWYRLLNLSEGTNDLVLPNWGELVRVFFTSQTLMKNSHIANTMLTGMDIDSVSVFGNFSGNRINAFHHAVAYCRRMLLIGATQQGKDIGSEADWERQLNVLLRTDKSSRQLVKDHMKTISHEDLGIFFTAAFEGMLWKHGKGLEDCGESLVELGALAPQACLSELATRASELLPAIASNDVATRQTAAQGLGMLGAHPSNEADQLNKILETLIQSIKLWDSAVGAGANKVHGSTIALSYLLSRSIFYGRIADVDVALIDEAVAQILNMASSATDASNKEAAFIAIGLLSTVDLVTEARLEASPYDAVAIIKVLTTEAKKGNGKAISALGRFALIFDESTLETPESPLAIILKGLYELHELRQAEVHFTVGEALAVASTGWESDSLILTLDVEANYKGPTRSSTLEESFWDLAFSLIQYCGHLQEIQSRLRECQAAFMGLLSARDDLVQETASRGLSLVYEQGDRDLRERLVADLVASFTGTSTKIKVEEDTELFEPGALPTGNGESVTSYKDIMSLAAEVGDQSLVYKFMSLASNAATWSTRAAFGRFGLSSILSESAVDPKLYPKLFRYRFDPNPNVQRSMNDIWNALVKSPTVVIDEYFDAIMDDLLKNILGKEWRIREASCAAIADLVQGRQFEKYEKYLAQIWEVAFKVLDDIKGSVRKAAEKLCQVLTGILVRQLEAGTSSKNAQVMLKEVMPFLFSTRGLESPSNEVQKFAYDTVLKLVKSGGKTLLPFIPSLIEQILGLLSTLEPDIINYLHMNAAKYDTTQEKIDEARSTAISHSPMMEAIERCLDHLDDKTMKDLVPHLENVIKTAVGMPSKVGCSGVLVSLATRHSFVFKPHADIFLKDIEKAVRDRNSTVSAAYARAAGYLARLGSNQQILKLATYSKNIYFAAEDEAHRQVSADIIYAMSKFATDRFNALATEFLPFVFMARHDFDEHVRDQFTKTWDENVGGSRAVLLYLQEITDIAVERLDSPKWTIKHTAALTIADVVTSAGTDISIPHSAAIWPALESALAVKTFDGKEKVLTSFVKFSQASKTFWSKDPKITGQMTKIAIREAKRNNDAYRPHAFLALGEYAEARTDTDLFIEVHDVIWPWLEKAISDDKMDVDDKDDKKASSLDTLTITNGVSALIRAVNTKSGVVENTLSHLRQLLERIKAVFASQKSSINARVALYERSKLKFSALAKGTPQAADNYALAAGYFSLLEVPSGVGSEVARTKRAEAAEAVIDAVVAGVFGQDQAGRVGLREDFGKQLREASANERALGVKRVLQSCSEKLSKI
ncbi:hypothetical protein GMDG_06146 [Pseudogymnoascus destructans 20631-21]|uniref:Proteasome component M29 n=1 Tax=Pseudogymnoascus destructans (strain ATCC MYA-4855 / 20631-21) TaxID=658429 RepID=L8FS66_PSED2|nr:hypothetical protein GMDG_06146 [Pseudogymnoascus destructans 20631-21]